MTRILQAQHPCQLYSDTDSRGEHFYISELNGFLRRLKITEEVATGINALDPEQFIHTIRGLLDLAKLNEFPNYVEVEKNKDAPVKRADG